MKNKKILIILLVVAMVLLSACEKEEKSTSNFELYNSQEESIIAAVTKISGDKDININDYSVCEFIEGESLYSLIYSKSVSAGTDEDYFNLIVTTSTEEGNQFYTQTISKDQQLVGELTEEQPYIGFTVQNDTGTVFMSVVQVISDEYVVKYEGEVCESPKENIYVQAAKTQPDLKISEASDDSDSDD